MISMERDLDPTTIKKKKREPNPSRINLDQGNKRVTEEITKATLVFLLATKSKLSQRILTTILAQEMKSQVTQISLTLQKVMFV